MDASLFLLEPLAFWVLVGAALLTSMLSAVVGMAGGITLLVVMLLFLDPLEAIPLHGAVQLVSNGSRTWIQRRSIRWAIVWPYALPLLPFGFLGLLLITSMPSEAVRLAIGAFVLVATWIPWVFGLGSENAPENPTHRFLGLGAVVGVLNVTLGAVGPMIAPFYLNLGLNRFELIGSKAASQTLAHVAKVIVFSVVGFAFAAHVPLLLVLALSVLVGTAIGSRLLGKVSENAFVVLYKVVLTLIAVRLVVGEAWALLG